MGGISIPAPPAKAVRRRERRGTGRVRITDVAKLAGVAPITVSRVLNTPDSVATETLRRVREAIDRIGYVPDMLAGGLASSCSHLIAAVVPTIASPVFQETWEALTETFASAGYHVTFGQTGYGGTREEELLDAIVARRPDGIVVTGIMSSSGGRRRLLAAGVPVVETWDLTPTPIDMGGGLLPRKYRRGRGRVPPRQGQNTNWDDHSGRPPCRTSGEGLDQRDSQTGNRDDAGSRAPDVRGARAGNAGQRPRRLGGSGGRHPEIDAVFCSSDMLALGAVIEAQARGISVPEKSPWSATGISTLRRMRSLPDHGQRRRLGNRAPGGALHH